jgi:hypothetical protein
MTLRLLLHHTLRYTISVSITLFRMTMLMMMIIPQLDAIGPIVHAAVTYDHIIFIFILRQRQRQWQQWQQV